MEGFRRESLARHDLPEIDAEGAELSIEVSPLHTDAFRQLADLPTAEYELLLQIRSLEMFSSFAKRHRE